MRLRFLLLCCLAVFTGTVCCADSERSRLHGPIEYLQLNLPQSARDERLLNAAVRELKSGAATAAFEALQQVFAQQHDTFTPISHERDSRSIYQSALELLYDGPTELRQQWAQHQQPAAVAALQQALHSGNLSQLRMVARQFPLTAASVQSVQLQAALAQSRGQHQLAGHLLEHLQQHRNVLPASVRKLVPPHTGSTALIANRSLGHEAPETAAADFTAVPSEELLWRYSLPVWQMPEVAAAMAGLLLPENRSVLSKNAWQATLRGQYLVFRSPVAVSAFDKISGKLLWTLPTDTVYANDHSQQSEMTRHPIDELLQMTDYSGITVHDNSLYFADGFRRLVDRSAAGAGRSFRAFPNISDLSFDDESGQGGSRLVSVSLNPPVVRWIVGDRAEFQYRLQATDVSGTASTDAQNSSTDFLGHRFLGSPLCVDGQLFVLTADGQQVWLNCLNDGDGSLLWRNPLMFNDEKAHQQSRYIAVKRTNPGASVCTVWQDSVLSVLQSGVVVANDVHSGHLRWATNLRSPTETELDPTSAVDADFLRSAGTVHQPVLDSDRLFVITSESPMVTCVDVRSGGIHWQTSRRVDSDGLLEGSVDNNVLCVTSDQLILAGSRHLRALDVLTGRQLWATHLQHSTGRPASTGNLCLVPQMDGTVVAVNLKHGRLLPHRLGSIEQPLVGSLTVDHDVCCVSTPLSVTTYPITLFSSGPAKPTLTKARQLIWQQNPDAAIHTLQQMASIDGQKRNQSAEQLLADLLLQQLRDSQRSPATDPPLTSNDRIVIQQQLNSLPLPEEQRLRQHVFSGTIPTEFSDRSLVSIEDDWSVRADIAVLAETVATLQPTEAEALEILASDDDAALELQTVFANSQSNQTIIADAARRRAGHRILDRPAAEALLTSRLRTDDRQKQKEAQRLLNNLRQDQVGRLRPFGPAEQSPQAINDISQSAQADQLPAPVTFDERLLLTSGSRFAEITSGVRTSIDTPTWYPLRLFVVGQNLFTVDPDTGAVSVPIPLQGIVRIDSDQTADDRPSLIPFVNDDQIGMLSLLAGPKPTVLWQRRIARPTHDLSTLEIGPSGAGFLIVGSSSKVVCLHPLTGSVLWERSLSMHSQPTNVYRRQQRLVGNAQVVGIVGAGGRWCELFRTSDGTYLGNRQLDIPTDQTPLFCDGKVLLQREDRLVLLDLATGEHLLDEHAPIEVAGRSHALRLKNNRALVLTSDKSLVVIDMQSGRIELQEAIADRLPPHPPSGLTAFERDDRLYVVVRDWSSSGSEYSASSRIGDDKVESGTLFCVDLDEPHVKWRLKCPPSVWPKIAGDPSPFLLSWSTRYPARQLWQRRIPSEGEAQEEISHARSITMRVIDRRTGAVVGQATNLSPFEPLRAVHDADGQVITVHTEKSVVRISYGNEEANARAVEREPVTSPSGQ